LSADGDGDVQHALAVQGRFEGRLAFREQVRAALAQAARQGAREIVLCDPDFEDWPLQEQQVAQSLHAWARSGRQARLLAGRWGRVQRHDARFVEWRRRWSHLVEARSCDRGDLDALPSVLWTPGWALKRQDAVRSVGWAGAEAAQLDRIAASVQALWNRATPAFPATTLGL
jgi:hypothetical protein